MNVLVVAAHPDDEVLGCGGTITRLAGENNSVSVVILGQGAASRHASVSSAAEAEIGALKDRSLQAARIMGVAEVLHFGLPDNRFDSLDLLDVVKIIEGVVDKVKPQCIFTHFGGDLNVDHQITHLAVLTATRPVAGCGVREIFAFEVASSTEWSFGRLERIFNPTVFMDVSATLERKIEAMAVYETEGGIFPHPRSLKALRYLAGVRGAAVGLEAVEAFELVRGIYSIGHRSVL
jgi:LmbE family N-acetylglucosaminyl deacetylase